MKSTEWMSWRVGAMTEPCGTPTHILRAIENTSLNATGYWKSSCLEKPDYQLNRVYTNVTKTLKTSSRAATVVSFWWKAWWIIVESLRVCWLQETPLRRSNCSSGTTCSCSITSFSLLWNSFSSSLQYKSVIFWSCMIFASFGNHDSYGFTPK